MTKPSLFDLIDDLAAGERALREQCFVAPQVPGGQIRVRVDGLVGTYPAEPSTFEGWGIYLLENARAVLQSEAQIYDVASYLELGASVPMVLCFAVRGRTWVAFPQNASDANQRLGGTRPMLVHLVEGGSPLEVVRTRFDGSSLWYVEVDRSSDPEMHQALAAALQREIPPSDLRVPGASPEMKTAYEMAGLRRGLWRPPVEVERPRPEPAQRRGSGRYAGRPSRAPRSEGERLQRALGQAGGQLESCRDHGEHWLVNWRTSEGVLHTSAITKGDLTVLSAGFCLDGHDRAFDLQSLVEVARGWDTGDYW